MNVVLLMGIFQTILIWIFIISLILSILYHGLQWIFFYVNDTWWDEAMKNVSRNESMPLAKGQAMATLEGIYIVAVSYTFYHHYHQSTTTIGKSTSFYFKVYRHRGLFENMNSWLRLSLKE